MNQTKDDQIRQSVREVYREIAVKNTEASCCGPSCCTENTISAAEISKQLGYSAEDVTNVPEGANMGLGCGNPQAIAGIKPGETILDLGSGGGFD